MADLEKRRRHPKLSERFPVTVLTQEGEAIGETRSLTIEGVFFHCPERLREGEICRMRIELPERRVEMVGRLAWSNMANFKPEQTYAGNGFCFMKMSGEDRDRLGDVIESYGAGKGQSSRS